MAQRLARLLCFIAIPGTAVAAGLLVDRSPHGADMTLPRVTRPVGLQPDKDAIIISVDCSNRKNRSAAERRYCR